MIKLKIVIHKIFNRFGYELKKLPNHIDSISFLNYAEKAKAINYYIEENKITKIHFACGSNLFDKEWINVDFYQNDLIDNYFDIDLTKRHPFTSNSIEIAYCEDFIEHLNQADSIFFLSEVYRILKKKGTIRLSFPGLEGVLKTHFEPCDYNNTIKGIFDAYTKWGHLHFYSKEELSLLGKHIGFTEINFYEFKKSNICALAGIDRREEQKHLNTYVELIK